MKLSSVFALFSVATSALGEKSAPAISDGSTAETALTPNFLALSQNALNQLSSLVQKSPIYLVDTAISAYQDVQDGVLAIDYKHLPTDVIDWIIAHPYQTVFHIVGGVVFFTPGLVSTPLLGVLGWTSVGPRTASVASGIQATLGTGAAHGIFATVQSAPMGGYGVAPVAWSTRAGVGAFQAVAWAWGGEKQKVEDAKDESGAEALEKSNS